MKTKNLLIVLSVAALFFLAGCTLINRTEVCTQEARLCPDGSSVGRGGPLCEFAPCPNCTCPNGYIQEADTCNPACYYNTPKCLAPSVHCNATLPSNATPTTSCISPSGKGMGIDEAKQIAQASECTKYGTLTNTPECNNFTGSWWFMLNLYNKTDLCRAACNVYAENKTAEIVWMCTGVITDEDSCVRSGGNVMTQLCCNSVGDFSDTCGIGACGCSPDNSHQVKVCDCGIQKCWDTDKHACVYRPVIAGNATATEAVTSVVNANNQFAFDLYSQYKSKDENIFFSPYSISTALAMTYEAARGKTAEEMQAVFHFPQDNSTRRTGFAAIYNEINRKDKGYNLSTANALWAQKDYKFLDTYFNLIRIYYGGNVTNLDFVGDTENSRITINNWVAEQTNDKIKDLIPQGYIDQSTRLVLTNAVYFKAKWYVPFLNDTQDADFRISPGNTTKVKMMSLYGDNLVTSSGESASMIFNYTETNETQILELPYETNETSMLIILPKGDNLQSLEQSLTPDKLNEWRASLNETYLSGVYLPKFKFETKYFMVDTLKDMGMKKAFDPAEADFSGMDGTRNLYISEVIHQAFIDVNETGTEAAAATAVIMNAGIAPGPVPPVFRADHPFIFIIQQKDTGNILFLGRVSNPNG